MYNFETWLRYEVNIWLDLSGVERPELNATGSYEWKVNIGSGNRLALQQQTITWINVNSMKPSDATNHHFFRQQPVFWPAPSLYLNQCWSIINWNIGNKFKWNLNRNSYIFIQENAFEYIVWKMATILYRPQCVMQYLRWHQVSLIHRHLDGMI